jgi:hypothetical protein
MRRQKALSVPRALHATNGLNALGKLRGAEECAGLVRVALLLTNCANGPVFASLQRALLSLQRRRAATASDPSAQVRPAIATLPETTYAARSLCSSGSESVAVRGSGRCAAVHRTHDEAHAATVHIEGRQRRGQIVHEARLRLLVLAAARSTTGRRAGAAAEIDWRGSRKWESAIRRCVRRSLGAPRRITPHT